MDWHCLGHAMWLVEANGLRLLFDPLLEDAHHGGVFRVFPGRIIDASALRADFVFVSHRHPDHFDPKSLRRLAELDPDSVVVTPDPLVAEIATLVGFRSVRLVAAETTIALDGVQLLTTPSPHANDPEWGLLVATDDGVVWNQVDTSLGGAADVERFFARAATALARPRELTLALARWQPLLEVAPFLAGDIGFPFEAYAAELEHIVATNAAVVCPSSAGACHAGPFAGANRLVYPVTEAQFARDLRRRAPNLTVVENIIGATYRVRGGRVEVDPRGAIANGLVSDVRPAPDPRDYRPFAIPELVDPNATGLELTRVVERIEHWVESDLRPALEKQRPFVRLLEVVLPSETRRYVFGGSEVDPLAWDLRCAVAGSLLVEVLDGRLHWGDLLLGGMLRAATRAYTVDARGLHRAPEQPLFLYHALSYEESARRAAFAHAGA